MNILSILGSPHGTKGNTGRLLSLVIEGALTAGARNETVVLPGRTVLPCLACDVCHVKGACPQKDDFAAILEKALAADGIILASPNYIFSVSAQLKAFLDRCGGIIHMQAFSGKYGCAVVTSGGGDEAPVADYLNRFLLFTGAVPVGAVWATMGEIEGDLFPPAIRDKALALGRDLVLSFREKKIPEGHDAASQSFRERMKKLVIWRQNDWPYEYDWWKKHQGLI